MQNIAIVLVDFDNIDYSLRTDLHLLENRLFSAVSKIQKYDEINLRFYGGWDYQKKVSRSAASISPWIHSFPHVINHTVLNAEIARSLAFEKVNLPFTYRCRKKRINIQVDTSQICVSNNTCDLFRINQIFANKKCSKLGCNKLLNEAFLINEQKLVDTMIATDLHYFSTLYKDHIFLVSSDDDFVPPIRYLCNMGYNIKVIHTHPVPYRYKKDYTKNIESFIDERSL
ncbi:MULTISPECIES: NYN domain-containing protein [unclassified Treponema]|uniref:NYN domain-containing protein n=1 Tax=unclassified Treponema TaxID=2638727 RepID=UPI0020A30160|nr:MULTISPECIES: NYN domain-containing protein [unclassified Treponema]UTC67847.1 NYN domain-containing protein [Treponema sp. OMZ 789]UTC70572.1 NYN domain-containing protein [Treponema sp. OMZ 790]UTC73285.1 NYN domain-containing protein [Treponema sp. OMZ 791]